MREIKSPTCQVVLFIGYVKQGQKATKAIEKKSASFRARFSKLFVQ
jgi:hypothetical protein